MTLEQKIKWILAQFKAMGASDDSLKLEENKLRTDINYVIDCDWLLN